MNFKVIFVCALVLQTSTIKAGVALPENCYKKRCVLQNDHLRFFLLGDWGGLPVWPFYTMAQNAVAGAMGYFAKQKGTDFQVGMGDNFYMIGVSNEWDDRFQASFENVYSQVSLRRTPWYMIGGNHDHYGNMTAQIAYGKRSWRWTFPSLYYTVQYQLKNGTTVDLIMLDTVVLCGQTRDGKFDSTLLAMLASSSKPKGPANKEEAEIQWTWIENQLRNSTADYLFVVGHYPVWSVADHGPTQCLVDRLNPMLIKYNVSAYFAGHDHNLQHLQITRNQTGTPLDYIVSGAGAFLDASSEHAKEVPHGSLRFNYPKPSWTNLLNNAGFSKGAFVYADVTPTDATFTFYSGNKEELYNFKLKPRKLT